jgi:hypothetical protein
MKYSNTYLIIVGITVLTLSSCAWFGTKNPHTDALILPPDTIEVETPTTVEDVRG